ncbi:response regulator [Cohnella silvisoli]|uniref:Response regulator n=1 Tax=Cohnella silvisoli TaxID=2873699 RepID=A0ABV1KQN0_9BACL|nr:response regulator [Cohnella silvisoli]MCD9024661.1 response regulator [Cohnella silvisoli]
MTYATMIVEDEQRILAYMTNQLAAYPEFELLGCFDVPEEALAAFPALLPDVAFLDIQMPRLTGLALAEKLLRIKPDLIIVFLTAYEQYALDAFKVEAIDYILKPIGSDDIERVLRRLDKLRPAAAAVAPDAAHAGPMIRCLGTFEVIGRDGSPVRWPTKKAEELFAYFWMNKDRQIDKWALIDLLWPGSPENKGDRNLYTGIYRLKQVLQHLPVAFSIERGNFSYRFLGPNGLSDLEELRELANHREAVERRTERAMELFLGYRQPLFGSRSYSWSAPADAAVDEMMNRLGERLAEWWRRQGDAVRERAVLNAIEARLREAE